TCAPGRLASIDNYATRPHKDQLAKAFGVNARLCFLSMLFLCRKNRMRIYQEQLEVRSDGRGTYEITDDIQAKIDQSGLSNGIVTVFVQHTSCSLIIMENADPTARRDLEEFFNRIAPEDADYFTHGSEGSDD